MNKNRWGWLFDTTKSEPTPVYEVDITKPPIPPPPRMFSETFLSGGQETDLSRRTTQAWKQYIDKYGEAIRNQV